MRPFFFMRVDRIIIRKLAPNQFRNMERKWRVDIFGAGYSGTGVDETIAKATETAVNNWILSIELQRKD